MNTENAKRDELLVAEYALGVLPHDERVQMARRLDREPELQRMLTAWEERLLPLAERIEPVAPPHRALGQIEARLFGQTTRPVAGFWSSLFMWRLLAVASITGLVIVSYAYINELGMPAPAQYFTELRGDDRQIRLIARFDPASGNIAFNRIAGKAAPGRDFELWLIEGGNAPISLGVLPAREISAIAVPPQYAAKMGGALLAISDEPEGGSPTGAPTGPVVATGNLARL